MRLRSRPPATASTKNWRVEREYKRNIIIFVLACNYWVSLFFKVDDIYSDDINTEARSIFSKLKILLIVAVSQEINYYIIVIPKIWTTY